MEHKNPQSDNSALLKDAFLLLERGSFAQADTIFNLLLSSEPENAMVYFGKLCAELGVGSENELCAKCNEPIDKYSNYQMAMRYGNEKFKERLNGYSDAITNRLKAEESVRLSTASDSFFNQVKAAEEDLPQQPEQTQPPAQSEKTSPAYQKERTQDRFSIGTISRWVKKQPVTLVAFASVAVVLIAGMIVFFATRRTPDTPVIINPSGLVERALLASPGDDDNNALPVSPEDSDAALSDEHSCDAANYQESVVCSVCGERKEMLPAALAAYDDRIYSGRHGSLQYDTAGRDEPNPVSFDMQFYTYKQSTNPDLYEIYTTPTLMRPGIFEDVDVAERDGYEWTLLHIMFESVNLESNLHNLAAYGHILSFFTCDYYTEDMEREHNESYDIGDMFRLPSNWYGEDIEIVQTSIFLHEPSWNGIWSDEGAAGDLTFIPHSDSEPNPVFTFEILVAFYAPIDFDGVIIAFYNAANNPNFRLGEDESAVPVTNAELIDNDTVFIRLMP